MQSSKLQDKNVYNDKQRPQLDKRDSEKAVNNNLPGGAFIDTLYSERFTVFDEAGQSFKNVTKDHRIRTENKVPKLGVMLVGLGGNNGSTLVAGILANKKKLSWECKNGTMSANYYGSFT